LETHQAIFVHCSGRGLARGRELASDNAGRSSAAWNPGAAKALLPEPK
jgi:hypothetical protein